MNETKNILLSKTFQGILVMILGALLPRLGLDFGDAELGQVANDLILAGGALWAAWGRITAKKGVTMGRGAKNCLVFVCAFTIAALAAGTTGCAVKKVSEAPAYEQARFYAQQVGKSYLDISEGYRAVYPSLSPEKQAWCGKELLPVLLQFKNVSDAMISAAILWSDIAEGGISGGSAEASAALASSDAARKRYEELAAQAANLMATAQTLYDSLTEED